MYLNKVTIIGNITRDIELKALPSGQKVANFSVATNRVWKDKDDKKQEQAEFHNVVAFGKQAETIAQYMSKGSQILVEGRLQTRSWETDGVKKYATEIILEQFQFGAKGEKKEEVMTPEQADKKFEEMTKDDNYPTEDSIDPADIPF